MNAFKAWQFFSSQTLAHRYSNTKSCWDCWFSEPMKKVTFLSESQVVEEKSQQPWIPCSPSWRCHRRLFTTITRTTIMTLSTSMSSENKPVSNCIHKIQGLRSLLELWGIPKSTVTNTVLMYYLSSCSMIKTKQTLKCECDLVCKRSSDCKPLSTLRRYFYGI